MDLPAELEDKIYQITLNSDETVLKIVSYFPLSEEDKTEILKLKQPNSKYNKMFLSIFSDQISLEEWNKSKSQIKKRFQDELFDID